MMAASKPTFLRYIRYTILSKYMFFFWEVARFKADIDRETNVQCFVQKNFKGGKLMKTFVFVV